VVYDLPRRARQLHQIDFAAGVPGVWRGWNSQARDDDQRRKHHASVALHTVRSSLALEG
jgi:hypothetical protein